MDYNPNKQYPMKKFAITLALVLGTASIMAQSPEDKAAAKAAEKAKKEAIKQANARFKEGIGVGEKILLLQSEIQLEKNKADKADASIIAAKREEMLTLSMQSYDIINEALQTGLVDDAKKFDGYRQMEIACSRLLNNELENYQSKRPVDVVAMEKAVNGVCDAYHGEMTYGKETNPQQKNIIEAARGNLPESMKYYAYLCQFSLDAKNIEAACRAMDGYVAFPQKYPEVAQHVQVATPQIKASQLAAMIFSAGFDAKNTEICNKYAPLALDGADENTRQFVQSRNAQLLKDQGKTDEWMAYLKSVIAAEPSGSMAELFMQQIMAYLDTKSAAEIDAFTAEMIKLYPDNHTANYCRGYYLAYKADLFEQGAELFKKAYEIKPDYVDAVYNCGYCYYKKAINKASEVSGMKQKTQAAVNKAEAEVKDLFRQAMPYFERLRELSPDDSDRWAGPLNTIYKNIGEKEKAQEIQAYLQ